MNAVQSLRQVLLAAAALVIAGAAFAAELETRSSSAAGVTVKVTPKGVAPGSATWAFVVVLDTHSRDLSDDLVKRSVLLDAQGARYSPLAWEGAPPGGHHRAGVLLALYFGILTLVSGWSFTLAQFQVELFWVGLAFNAAGIAYVGTTLWKASRAHAHCVA